MLEHIVLFFASVFAGGIDAIVGGGGLILIPALFITFPQAEPAALVGTNKSAGVWGTIFSATRYLKQVNVSYSVLLPASIAGIVGSIIGALLLLGVPTEPLRVALPIILVLLLIYTTKNKDLGKVHSPKLAGTKETLVASVIGFVVGVYDGFFGPGTGSFIIFAFAKWLGYDFLYASVSAKVINSATNISALVVFLSTGNILWEYVVLLIVGNLVGAFFGTRLALKKGAGFVRIVFIVIVSILIIRTTYDAIVLIG